MGYAPNAIHRGLVMQRTQTIGVIVTTIEDPFVSEIVRGIEEVAGTAAIVCSSARRTTIRRAR